MNVGEIPSRTSVEYLIVGIGQTQGSCYLLKLPIRHPRVYIHTTNVSGTRIGIVKLIVTEKQSVWWDKLWHVVTGRYVPKVRGSPLKGLDKTRDCFVPNDVLNGRTEVMNDTTRPSDSIKLNAVQNVQPVQVIVTVIELLCKKKECKNIIDKNVEIYGTFYCQNKYVSATFRSHAGKKKYISSSLNLSSITILQYSLEKILIMLLIIKLELYCDEHNYYMYLPCMSELWGVLRNDQLAERMC